jgi:hypothetical protein
VLNGLTGKVTHSLRHPGPALSKMVTYARSDGAPTALVVIAGGSLQAYCAEGGQPLFVINPLTGVSSTTTFYSTGPERLPRVVLGYGGD